MIYFTILAGTPTTTALSGTSLITTAPAPIREFLPIYLHGGKIIALVPINAFSRINTLDGILIFLPA